MYCKIGKTNFVVCIKCYFPFTDFISTNCHLKVTNFHLPSRHFTADTVFFGGLRSADVAEKTDEVQLPLPDMFRAFTCSTSTNSVNVNILKLLVTLSNLCF